MSSANSTWKLAGLALTAFALSVFSSGCCDDSCGVVVVDRTPPTTPTGLYPVTGDQTVTLLWFANGEPDIRGYSVYWRFEGERNFKFLADVLERDFGPDEEGRFFVDKGLQNGTTYEYIVTAFDRSGNESQATYIVFDTPRPEGSTKLYNIELRDLGGNFLWYNAYDFSEFRRTDWVTDEEADILFSNVGNLFLMEAGDNRTDIQDAGFIPLEDIDWAPDEGYSGTGTAELIVGHSYIVWTRTNNFAKFQVVDMPATGPDAGTYVVINWAYQEVTGLPELLRAEEPSGSAGAALGGLSETGGAGRRTRAGRLP